MKLAWLGVLPSLLFASSVRAEDLTLRVAPNEKLSAALDRAAEHLARCKTCTVTIRVAGGEQRGKAGVGAWKLPEISTPEATLRILGGWDAAFTTRAPFSHPTVLTGSGRRSAPVLELLGRKSALKELVLSGFAIDVGYGNSYDAKTGQLFKGSSSSWPVLAFGSLAADRLIIADNIFMNAANSVGGPRIKPASKSAEVVLRNNFFLNNVHCWQLAGLPSNPTVARYKIEHNTFVRNFPYNPDKNTSNPGALELGNKYTADVVELRGNLFAENSGGAIFAQWDDAVGPKVELIDNLFFANGALFGTPGSEKGAVVGKFNGSAVHLSLSAAEVAEDFSWKTSGNVVLDPKIELGAAESGGRGSDGETDSASEGGEEIVRDAAIDAFARRMSLDLERLPFPKTDIAKKYGASPDRVISP